MGTSRQPLVIALCLGALIASLFHVMLSTVGDGRQAIAESDQVIYLQYARNMAQGHPFVYTPDDPPSTGSTTHLYIYLLALLHKLGARGDAFLAASYVVNGLCYLGSIVMTWLIARRFSLRIANAAMFMVLLSGHTVAAALHQTDIGLFSLLALSLFAAILYNRFIPAIVLSVACGMTRPEGFLFAIALLLTGLISLLSQAKQTHAPGTKKQSIQFIILGVSGAVAFACSLLINFLYTGYSFYISVINKGYFNSHPFMGAIKLTLIDVLSLLKGVFFGLSTMLPFRQFYFFPLLGGLLALTGILLFSRKDKRIQWFELFLFIAVTAVLFTIATSACQGISNDRYLAWVLPLWIIYALVGAKELHERTGVKLCLPILTALLFMYQAISLVFFVCKSYEQAVLLQQREDFICTVREEIPVSESMGSTLGSGINFYLPEHKAYNLFGILSPGFFEYHFDTQILRIIDKLKHQPDLRFEHWLTDRNFLKDNPWAKPFFGELHLINTDAWITGTPAECVYHADWSILDGGETPRLLNTELQNLTLMGMLDVGYFEHEQQHDYDHDVRLSSMKMPLAILTSKLGTNTYAEVGRMIIGSEAFNTSAIKPHKPLKLVLRTATTTEFNSVFSSHITRVRELEMASNLMLELIVDGKEIECPSLNISGDGFREVVMHIPAEAIRRPTPRIEVVGDHISFAYWFYQ